MLFTLPELLGDLHFQVGGKASFAKIKKCFVSQIQRMGPQFHAIQDACISRQQSQDDSIKTK